MRLDEVLPVKIGGKTSLPEHVSVSMVSFN